MFFLFGLIKNRQGKRSPFMRDTSMWIYILHPLVIIVVRGGARVVGLTDLLVGNSIIFFLCVAALSFACAVLVSMRKKLLSGFMAAARDLTLESE